MKADSDQFLRARVFLDALKRSRNVLPYQAVLTLRGQALAGDIEGAWRGLERMLGMRRENESEAEK